MSIFGHTYIDASAGCGKTYTITEKVMERIKAGYDIKSFLIMTYTEKAAGELVDRIRSRINKVIKDNELDGITLSPVESDLFKNALKDFDFATISTIHGFCKKVLSEYAFECGICSFLCWFVPILGGLVLPTSN